MYHQAVIDADDLRQLQRRVEAAGGEWACCPYPHAGPNRVRILADRDLGHADAFRVGPKAALKCDASISTAGGRCSPGWRAVRRHLEEQRAYARTP